MRLALLPLDRHYLTFDFRNITFDNGIVFSTEDQLLVPFMATMVDFPLLTPPAVLTTPLFEVRTLLFKFMTYNAPTTH